MIFRLCALFGGMMLPVACFLFACGTGEQNDPPLLTVWIHSAQPAERQTIRDQIRRFNAEEEEYQVHLTIIPEDEYNGQVQAAAVAGDLPDLLVFDGPYVYNYVWQGILIPLGPLLPDVIMDDLIPSLVTQGTYRDTFYSVGTYDSGLGLYARKSHLDEIGARIPHGPEDAWSIDEFDAILAALADAGPNGRVLDLKLNYQGEYFTYAYSPILQSAGADLIDRRDYRKTSGVLNSPAAVAAMMRLQRWFEAGYVDPNLDDAAFTEGRVSLSWVGHWEYSRYHAAWGDDVVILPLPDFGTGSRTGQGSWNWGITRFCGNPEWGVRFLRFLLQPEEVLAMSRADSAVPATKTAMEKSPLYREGGPLRLFAVQLLEGYGVSRPRTPAYPVITSVFSDSFLDIRHGGDVKTILDRASTIIDRDIAFNKGYPD